MIHGWVWAGSSRVLGGFVESSVNPGLVLGLECWRESVLILCLEA